MLTLKIKIGTLTLTEARDESIPQQFAAWHQTVRIEPGIYDVFAFLEKEGGLYYVKELSAACSGVTISSNFRSHMHGVWGSQGNNRDGQVAGVRVHLPTFGSVDRSEPLLARASLGRRPRPC